VRVVGVLKPLVPSQIRTLGHRLLRQATFVIAMREFCRDPRKGSKDYALLERIRYGWGNEGWSANEEFLSEALQIALDPNSRILECGSGLSTLLMSICAESSHAELTSLEHNPAWRCKLQKLLRRYGANRAVVLSSPLTDYGDFCWYQLPDSPRLHRRFTAVVCDGPPGDTPGGRYGLLPLLQEWLAPACLILLDDLERQEEQAVAESWTAQFGISCEIVGEAKPFARLRTSGSSSDE